jgi:hypothetical protein
MSNQKSNSMKSHLQKKLNRLHSKLIPLVNSEIITSICLPLRYTALFWSRLKKNLQRKIPTSVAEPLNFDARLRSRIRLQQKKC